MEIVNGRTWLRHSPIWHDSQHETRFANAKQKFRRVFTIRGFDNHRFRVKRPFERLLLRALYVSDVYHASTQNHFLSCVLFPKIFLPAVQTTTLGTK